MCLRFRLPVRADRWYAAAMRAALLAVVVLGLGCKRGAPEARTLEPPTLEEAKQFATDFAKLLTPCDSERLEKVMDIDLMIDRMIAGRAIKRSELRDLRRGFVGTLCSSLDSTWTARHVHTREKAGVPKPLIRLTSDAGIEYLELELDKHDGKVRVADLYVFTRGELMTQTMTIVMDTLLERKQDTMSASLQLQSLQRHLAAKEFRQAYDAVQRLPAAIRTMKQVRQLEVRAAMGMEDDVMYLKVIESYAAAFPGDPSLDLIQIDGAYLRKDWDGLLKLIDNLDKRIADPFLDTIRATTHAEAGRWDVAVKHAKQASIGEPSLPDVWRILLTVQVGAGHNRGALKTLETLQQKFKELLDEASLRADPRWAQLADTDEYKASKK